MKKSNLKSFRKIKKHSWSRPPATCSACDSTKVKFSKRSAKVKCNFRNTAKFRCRQFCKSFREKNFASGFGVRICSWDQLFTNVMELKVAELRLCGFAKFAKELRKYNHQAGIHSTFS